MLKLKPANHSVNTREASMPRTIEPLPVTMVFSTPAMYSSAPHPLLVSRRDPWARSLMTKRSRGNSADEAKRRPASCSSPAASAVKHSTCLMMCLNSRESNCPSHNFFKRAGRGSDKFNAANLTHGHRKKLTHRRPHGPGPKRGLNLSYRALVRCKSISAKSNSD